MIGHSGSRRGFHSSAQESLSFLPHNSSFPPSGSTWSPSLIPIGINAKSMWMVCLPCSNPWTLMSPAPGSWLVPIPMVPIPSMDCWMTCVSGTAPLAKMKYIFFTAMAWETWVHKPPLSSPHPLTVITLRWCFPLTNRFPVLKLPTSPTRA